MVSLRRLARLARRVSFAFMPALAGLVLLSGGDARAATASTLPCAHVNYAGDASGFSLDCQVLDAENDKAETLNEQTAFSIDGWTQVAKYDVSSRSYEGRGFGFTVDGDGEGGAFSFDDTLWDQWSSAVILFKSGSAKQAEKAGSPGNVVMFLLQPDVLFGDYARSLGKYAISHISVYVAGADPFGDGSSATQPLPTPLPASALLLVGGLAALGMLSRRRRGRAAA